MSGQPEADAALAIAVRVDDLVFASGDAIAWPVSAELKAVTPLLRRLEAAGAGDLCVELLINAVVSSDTEPISRAGVRRALTSALQRACDWQIEHLVCTPFGLGAGNLDLEESAEIMVEILVRDTGPGGDLTRSRPEGLHP